MNQQLTTNLEENSTETQIEAMAVRIAQLEAELQQLQITVRHLPARETEQTEPVNEPINGIEHQVHYGTDASIWTAPPEDLVQLQTLSEDELVPVSCINVDDIHNRIGDLEKEYGITSAAFYQRWKAGNADEIRDKTSWVILYETTLRNQTTEIETHGVLE